MRAALSPTWSAWERALRNHIHNLGVHRWREFPEIKRNIRLGDQEHYRYYASRCEALLWPEEGRPNTIVDFGAGYGGMAEFWPSGAHIINVDVPPMLDIQRRYLVDELGLNLSEAGITLLDLDEIRLIDWSKAHFFSAFSFTETTLETWRWAIDKVFPVCRGAYITGSKGWSRDGPLIWPWAELRRCFREVVSDGEVMLDQFAGSRMEFCGRN